MKPITELTRQAQYAHRKEVISIQPKTSAPPRSSKSTIPSGKCSIVGSTKVGSRLTRQNYTQSKAFIVAAHRNALFLLKYLGS